MVRTKRLSWMSTGLILGSFLMGVHGPCSPSGCPDGAFRGPDRACWLKLNTQEWRTVNHGELQVRLRQTNSPLTKKKSSQAYKFVFIQDPKEVYTGKKKGRFGDWRIQVKQDSSASQAHTMLLRWRLRDQPHLLNKAQTIRLVATWNENGKRKYQTLTGQYLANKKSVQAILPASLHQKSALWLFPARKHSHKLLHRTALLSSFPR